MEEKIKRIKKSRIKPQEKFLIDILEQTNMVICPVKPYDKYYYLNDDLIIHINHHKSLRINNDIWKVLVNDFNLHFKQACNLIRSTLASYYKITVLSFFHHT
jgi:hypothetical protein